MLSNQRKGSCGVSGVIQGIDWRHPLPSGRIAIERGAFRSPPNAVASLRLRELDCIPYVKMRPHWITCPWSYILICIQFSHVNNNDPKNWKNWYWSDWECSKFHFLINRQSFFSEEEIIREYKNLDGLTKGDAVIGYGNESAFICNLFMLIFYILQLTLTGTNYFELNCSNYKKIRII